ncbi:MAG: very short patch repair endonuclease [Chromatiaceae bacterium]|nr:very short patch repair endonuclease [Chromatiaceae bacterium]
MSRIRGKDTKPEVLLRRLLWAEGLRYRLNKRILGCRPDISFIGRKTLVFVDGCFWHGCPKHYARPRTDEARWSAKLRSNVERDIRQTQVLIEHGWIVLRFWEHEIEADPQSVVAQISSVLHGGQASHRNEYRVVEVRSDPQAEDMEDRILVDLYGDLPELKEKKARSSTKRGPVVI